MNRAKLKEITRLTLENLNGSLKINSSIMGPKNEMIRILIKLKLISFLEGNKLIFLKGKRIPK